MPSSMPDLSTQCVATPPSGLPVYCPVCQQVPLTGKQQVCSAKCRIQKSMATRAATRADRDAKARLLLRTVIETAQEVAQLLKEP